MMVTGIFCLLAVAVAVGEDWAGGGTGTRSGHSSSESIYDGHLLEINGSKCISGGHLLETQYTRVGGAQHVTCMASHEVDIALLVPDSKRVKAIR